MQPPVIVLSISSYNYTVGSGCRVGSAGHALLEVLLLELGVGRLWFQDLVVLHVLFHVVSELLLV